MESSSSKTIPAWLEALVTVTFFNSCTIHEGSKNKEKNSFCLDCGEVICLNCLLDRHKSHQILQIRRHSYHYVIWVSDAEKFMDCSGAQAYCTNREKSFYLNPRPYLRSRRSSNSCVNCGRGLDDTSLFCSISCKMRSNNGMSLEGINESEVLKLPELSSEDQLISPESLSLRLMLACGTTTEIASPTSSPPAVKASCDLLLQMRSNNGMSLEGINESEVLKLPEPSSDDQLISPESLSLRLTLACGTTTEIAAPASSLPAVKAVRHRSGLG